MAEGSETQSPAHKNDRSEEQRAIDVFKDYQPSSDNPPYSLKEKIAGFAAYRYIREMDDMFFNHIRVPINEHVTTELLQRTVHVMSIDPETRSYIKDTFTENYLFIEFPNTTEGQQIRNADRETEGFIPIWINDSFTTPGTYDLTTFYIRYSGSKNEDEVMEGYEKAVEELHSVPYTHESNIIQYASEIFRTASELKFPPHEHR